MLSCIVSSVGATLVVLCYIAPNRQGRTARTTSKHRIRTHIPSVLGVVAYERISTEFSTVFVPHTPPNRGGVGILRNQGYAFFVCFGR
jgi:hypothetical protein